MMDCVRRKLTPKSMNNTTGMFDINSTELKRLYEQNTPFWKKKYFLFSTILMSCITLGLLTFFTVDEIYNQGKISNVIYSSHNSLQYKIETPVKLKNYSKSSRAILQRIRSFQTELEEIHEQEITVTCELNNGIKELNNEIKGLYNSLTQLDAQVNREKRGVNEKTAIIDCVQMKVKFKKIYEDLNRISETLSMIDDNGICRCKCPLDKITSTTAEVIHTTDLPFDLTTFTLENTNKSSNFSERTKQLKKIIVSNYNPQNIVDNINSKLKSITDEEEVISSTLTNEKIEFTTTSTIDDSTTQKATDITTEMKEDLSPAMSNSVTNLLSFNNTTPIVEAQTLYNEVVTKNYEAVEMTTFETLKSTTEILDSNETSETTKFNYDEISTTQRESLDKNEVLLITTSNDDILESTTETSDFYRDVNDVVTEKTGHLNETKKLVKNLNENISELTTETSDFYRDLNEIVTEKTGHLNETKKLVKNLNENISESTTEVSDTTKIHQQTYSTKITFELTSENEYIPELSTEMSVSEKYESSTYIITEKVFEITSENENISEFTTETSVTGKYESDTNVTERNSESTSVDEDISKSTTNTPISYINDRNTNIKERTSSEDQDDNDHNKLKDKTNIIQPITEKISTTNGNGVTFNYSNEKKTTQRPELIQPKWYPVCFYPVPCSPNVMNYQQNLQDTSKKTIQYSAQSLSAHKKNSPLTADATVIQNNYPIIAYCPVGMACPMTDFAGQANMLHCMLKSTFPETPENINKNNENTLKQIIKNSYNETKSPAKTKVKSARESDEILTGNLDCPANTFPCVDNSRCIDTENWCDGRIHCDDASDEIQCNCKERIDKDKLCDGYYDCPSGEDELGCFGCNNETFSCGDWNIVSQHSSCFDKKNRCDYVKHCPNGRDEDECTLLSRHLENPDQMFFISFTTGYLHHNWKGKWYPMCSDDRIIIETWAEKACTVESGEKSKSIKIEYMNELNTYDGPYISIDESNRINLLDSCKHQGILVECGPEVCGIRSEFRFNKNIDPDRMRRSPYSANPLNVTSRFARSKDPRVVGGIASNPGAWPWLIALYQDGIFHCGGVVLSDRWVLTAAHCVNQYQKHFYEIQAGILRRFSFSPMEQSRTVTHVIVHTQFSRATMENDLAVLRLERGLEFNRWVRPVCLPDQKLNWIPFPGTICTAVGWGSTVEHGPDPDNMREVEVPILPECTHKTDIDGREICAGYLSGGHDTCQGDSGGPLLCREPNNLNKWYVAGIVSHGEGCARPMEPGVYTRVALFMDWIIRVTDDTYLPQEGPQQYCPGIRCNTGKQCIPTKRQCDKYVDCMNAEDEQNCDYTGSQYNVNLYRSRNTDHSNFKYSKMKSVEDKDIISVNFTTTTPGAQLRATTVFQNVNKTSDVNYTAIQNRDIKVETKKIELVKVKNNNNHSNHMGLNDTVLNALRQLFDNQFTDEETFSCRRITQVVLSNHRCDGTVDCEDGTDEQACECKTRLANVYSPSAVCDGVADCHDGTDEVSCAAPKCKADERVCGRPRKCVKNSAWCDGTVDCGGDGSDEKYCVAITNGTSAVESDATGRPALQQSGMVAINRRGVWRIQCVDDSTASKIAHDTCSSLHFSNSEHYEKRISLNKPLPLNAKKFNFTDVCQGLYVECGARKTMDAGRFHWHADVFVDGTLARSGILIEKTWVLAKRTGFNLKTAYVTAVLGSGAYSSVWIKSPYEQIVRIDEIKEIPGTDLDLLHLTSPVVVSRGVTPLSIPLFQPSPGANDTCYAIGYSDKHNNKTETTYLRPDTKQCDDDNMCFQVTQKPQSCSNGKNTSHVTAVVCESNFGLFLAAPTVQHNMNFCDRNTRVQLPSAEDLMNNIADIIDEDNVKSPAPLCDGKRCQLGQCVPWEKVCDGIPNCRDEQDETIVMCEARTKKCKTNVTLCICDVGSFRCSNGKCVEKTAFCNGIDDCGDGTDEPKSCRTNTCVEYLKLTAPERLCDGRWDCLDKTDEEFANCPHYCNRTNVYQCQSSKKCISSELVCDGEEDCPESDDEAECIGLITPARKKYLKNEGILAIRSYGNWHAQCITEDYTNVDYHSLCRGLGFKYAVGIKKTVSNKVDFENFTIVQLNHNTDVTVRSATKNILQHTDGTCTSMYVVCSSS